MTSFMYLKISCTPETFWKHCFEFQFELTYIPCNSRWGLFKWNAFPPSCMSLHLRKVKMGRGFRWHENIKHMLRQWFQQQPRKFFAEGICRLATHSATLPLETFNVLYFFAQNNTQMNLISTAPIFSFVPQRANSCWGSHCHPPSVYRGPIPLG